MRAVAYCVIGGALALLGFGAVGSSALSAGMGNPHPAQVVDRAGKGDRLPIAASIVQKTHGARVAPRSRQPDAAAPSGKLPEGCDPLVSPLAGAATAGLTGRCLS